MHPTDSLTPERSPHYLSRLSMNELDRNQVHFITGITIAMDHEDGVLILGMLSDSPFSDNQAEAQTKEPISNFALTRQKAKFLREKLDEFLRESE